MPVVEIEVPPVTDALEPTLRTRLEALVETVRSAKSGSSFGKGAGKAREQKRFVTP